MYNAHNEHDNCFDRYINAWVMVSHYEMERKENKGRYIHDGDCFTSKKDGRKWKYRIVNNKVKVVPA